MDVAAILKKVVNFSSAETWGKIIHKHFAQKRMTLKSVTPSSPSSSSISSILSCALAKEPEGIWCIVASLANTRPDCLKERLHFNNSFSIQPRDDDAKKQNVSEQMRIFEIELFSSFSLLHGEESDGDIGNLCKLCRCFGPLPAQGRPAHNRYLY